MKKAKWYMVLWTSGAHLDTQYLLFKEDRDRYYCFLNGDMTAKPDYCTDELFDAMLHMDTETTTHAITEQAVHIAKDKYVWRRADYAQHYAN